MVPRCHPPGRGYVTREGRSLPAAHRPGIIRYSARGNLVTRAVRTGKRRDITLTYVMSAATRPAHADARRQPGSPTVK